MFVKQQTNVPQLFAFVQHEFSIGFGLPNSFIAHYSKQLVGKKTLFNERVIKMGLQVEAGSAVFEKKTGQTQFILNTS